MVEDITILKKVRTPKLRGREQAPGRLYYYQGNFFYPIAIHPKELGRVRNAIRKFVRENTEMIERDRNDPNYKTYSELCDEV